MEYTGKEKLDSFFSRFKPLRYKKGEIVLHAGDIPQGVFYVKKGLIRLYSVSHDGEEFTLIIFKPGDFFPISWAIADIPNNYFLEALSVLEIWRVEKASFVAFVKKNPDVLYEILNMMTVRLMSVLRRMEYMVFGNAYTKVASILVICAERFGRKAEEGIVIDVPLAHKDVAALLGVTRETVSLEMKKLKEKGIVDYSGRVIVVKSMARLRRQSTLER